MPRTRSPLRRLLNQTLSTSFAGLDSRLWRRLLRDNGYAVDPEYLPRAALVTLASVVNSVLGSRERRRHGAAIERTRVERPLFVLGHWRSGTSLLYRLLALDDGLAYPNLFQTMHPHTFLTTETALTSLASPLLPSTRPADGMPVGFGLPSEDELALAILSGHSFRVGRLFPRRERYYDRFLTFRDVDAATRAAWKLALQWYLKKLTWAQSRPLVLKSAPHTGRIDLLLEACPDARFVHIVRDPFAVYQSTCQELIAARPFSRLQRYVEPDLEGLVIGRYRALYDAFFEQRGRIPPGRLHEVRFERLEDDPVRELRALYEVLELPGFERLEPRLARYVEANLGYRKNSYRPLPETLRRRLAAAWERSFDTWGYSRQTG